MMEKGLTPRSSEFSFNAHGWKAVWAGQLTRWQVPAFPCCNVMFLFAFITGLRHWWDPGTSICRAAEDVQLAPNQLHLHPASTAIIAEGGIVMDDLQNLPEAIRLVFGLSYASHLDDLKARKTLSLTAGKYICLLLISDTQLTRWRKSSCSWSERWGFESLDLCGEQV